MNTPSHFLMTAVIAQALPRVPIMKRAFLWGSVAPDLPLWLLSIGGIGYYHWFLGWSTTATAQLMFGELFFHNPVWVTLHNFLHAPLIVITGIILTWRSRFHTGSSAHWLFWFLIACLLHTGIDILTHVDDGPLLWFPFNWQQRFNSGVSYWDDRYYGQEFQRFELALNALCLGYLVIPAIRRWVQQRWR